MAKLNIIILDSDEIFLEKISNYLINKTDKFTVISYSNWDSFIKLEEYAKQDVLLFSEEYIEQVKELNGSIVKILMMESFEPYDEEYSCVKKFQKLDSMVKEILIIHSEKTGDKSHIVSEKKAKKIISVYSPIGGCGKTTLAVIISKTLALSGANVLYLNFERVSSMSGIFNNNGNNGMTDIFFAAKTNKERIPSQILANIIQNQASKIYYINPAESCTEYAQMKDDEVEEILDVAEGLEKFDYIVIDFLGEFNKRVLDILKRSRKVVFPYLSHNLAIQKMNVFIDELKRLKQEETLMKTVFVENMAQQSDSRYDEIKIAYNENYINISNILKNYGMGFNDVEPIIRQI